MRRKIGFMAHQPATPIYQDRREAGRALAAHLTEFRGQPDVQVLALPRGGVPVGFEVARALGTPLDVLIVRKIGVPGQEELAMGAIASGGAQVVNQDVVSILGIRRQEFEAIARGERIELVRREHLYRGERPELQVAGMTVLLVDDGLATGSSMRVAVKSVQTLGARRIVVTVPVAPVETVAEFRAEGIELVCPAVPQPFYGVGAWYADFSQTSDEEVRQLLSGPQSAV